MWKKTKPTPEPVAPVVQVPPVPQIPAQPVVSSEDGTPLMRYQLVDVPTQFEQQIRDAVSGTTVTMSELLVDLANLIETQSQMLQELLKRTTE